MSVVGIDIGNLYAKIAVCRRGGVDVIANDVSSRQTPCMVSFGPKERMIGERALSQQVMSVTDTIGQLKSLVGRKYSEKEVQEELKNHFYANRHVEAETGAVGFQVNYKNEMTTFTSTQLMTMLLSKLKQTTETETKNTLKDVVIAVPGYWTSHQRSDFFSAASVVGLNVLKLVNEHAAVGIAYGLFKTDLSETDPKNVLFIDIGHSKTCASVISFTKSKMKVLSATFDLLGGRDFDKILFDHFVEEFKSTFKVNILENKRACVRLISACERLKKVLSANDKAPINIECIMNEVDVRGMLSRAEYDQLCDAVLQRIKNTMLKSIQESGLKLDQIDSVELIGGSIRIPAVQKLVKDVLSKDPMFTLNAMEAVSRGSALQCAILSPAFRVRDYKVLDITPFGVYLKWGEDADDSTHILTPGSNLPCTKVLTFKKLEPFTISATYEPNPLIAEDRPHNLGLYTISKIPTPKSPDLAPHPSIKVKVKLSAHGIFHVETAELEETIEEEVREKVKVPVEPAAMDVEKPKKDESEVKSQNPMETEPTADHSQTNGIEPMNEEPVENGVGEKKPEEQKPAAKPEFKEELQVTLKKKTRKHLLDITATQQNLITTTEVFSHMTELEIAMQNFDQLCIKTSEAKNALEEYILNIRGRLGDDLEPFVESDKRDALVSRCAEIEDWLYDEGDEQPLAIYEKKLKELKDECEIIKTRKNEFESRPVVLKELEEMENRYLSLIGDADHAHLTDEDRTKVHDEIRRVKSTLEKDLATQNSLPKTADPVLYTNFIQQQMRTLERVANPIVNKKKPEPKPEQKSESSSEAQKAGTEEVPKNPTTGPVPAPADQMEVD